MELTGIFPLGLTPLDFAGENLPFYEYKLGNFMFTI